MWSNVYQRMEQKAVITEVGQEGGLWITQIYQCFTIGKGLWNKHVIMVNITLFALWIGYLTGRITKTNWDLVEYTVNNKQPYAYNLCC